MSDDPLGPVPFLDWYGIFASHRKLEADGTVWSQEPPQGVRLRVEPGIKSPVFFVPERPWEMEANLHVNTVLREGGLYRLWYGASNAQDVTRSFTCYAESDDGFSWRRPDLGLVEYEGSRRNNILCEEHTHHLGAVFVDPSAPEGQRYKAIAPRGRYYRDGKLDLEMDSRSYKELLVAMDLGGVSPEERRKRIEIRQAVHASVSPDGLHWTNLDEPILDVGDTALDTHNLCAFDPHAQRYVAYLRGHVERRRLVRRAEGADFRRLDPPRPCLMCDPQDPIDDDIYNSCYCPYPGRRLHLMFASLYHRIASTVDIQLAFSRDSYNWSRTERRPIIDRSFEGGEYGAIYASPDLIPHDDVQQWRLALMGHRHHHDFRERGERYPVDFELRWVTWQPDRLAGLAAQDEGRVTMVQRKCAGRQLRLNYRTARDGWIKVELVHPPATPPRKVEPFDGFSEAEAEVLSGDELSRVASWRGRSDLGSLKDREVSVRVHMRRAELFSLAL